MRQIYLDELSREDVGRLVEWLNANATLSEVEGLYWVELTEDLLGPDQFEEKEDHPFCFAVEVGDSWAKFELLIRSRRNLKSMLTGYANQAQRRFILDYSYRIIDELNLRT